MRTKLAIMAGLALFSLGTPVRAAETPAKSRIVAVGLFKNGLAVIKREVTLGKSGTYVLDDVPQAVHGTYWVESTAPVESVVKMLDVDVPAAEAVPGNLQEDFAGKKVTIYFKGGKLPPLIGTIAKLKPPKHEEAFSPELARYADAAAAPARFLSLQTAKGRAYLDPTEIAYVEAEGTDATVKRRQARMLLKLGDIDKAETRVAISYLTRGLSWAPSYRIDITDPKTLTLEQQAVIRNELADLDGAEIKLISGFPSVQFAHVLSPLSTSTNWTTFFQQLNQRGWQSAPSMDNSAVLQQNMFNSRSPIDMSLGAIPQGEGVDLHYQSVGKRTLAAGENLALSVARGKSSYDRIVEWIVPDTRDEFGRPAGRRGRGEETDETLDSAWDALKFKNPFTFAMTTGPAVVSADGNFNGQRTSFWVNAGEETVLHVNKALSVRTRAIEHEEQKAGADGREIVWIGNHQYRKSSVEGELAISNHRAETIQLVLRRRFSGELVSAEGSPKSSLREEGVYSVNRRQELLWSFPLKAGEERKLKYRYTVLVAN